MIRLLVAVALVAGLFLVSPCIGPANAQGKARIFQLSWGDGYRSGKGNAERVPLTCYTDDSRNVDPLPDGSVKKRPGMTLDESLAGADTSISLMAQLLNANIHSPRQWGLVIADTIWAKRNQETGTYTELNRPPSVVSNEGGNLQATVFDGEIIVGGDLSAAVRFAGGNPYRLIIPVPFDSTAGQADTLTGTTGIDSGTVRSYCWTWVNDRGKESHRSGMIHAPVTSATAQACSVYGMPLYPAEFYGGSDTTQITKRLMYVSEDSGATGDYLTALDARDSTFVDSGQYYPGLDWQPDRRFETALRMPAVFHGQLWAVGSSPKQLTQYAVVEPIDVSETSWLIYPALSDDPNAELGKVKLSIQGSGSATGNLSATLASNGDGRYTVTATGAQFNSVGVVPGDYLFAQVTTTGGIEASAEVMAVLDDDHIVIDYNFGGVATNVSIGSNVFQIDSEIVGVYGNFTHIWDIAGSDGYNTGRGFLGTTAATHANGTRIYRVNHWRGTYDYHRSLIYSEEYNAIAQVNADDPEVVPLDEITGLFAGSGYLGIAGKSSVKQARGFEELTISDLAVGIGNAGPRSLVPYGGGAFVLDRAGPYFVSADNVVFLGNPLQRAMRDSAAAGRYDDASGYYHDGKLYYSVPKNAADSCIVYVADLTRRATDGEYIWTRYEGWEPSAWCAWTDINGDDDLHFGEWDEGTVYKVNETGTADQDASGNSIGVTVRVVSPRLRVRGYQATWDLLTLHIATNDSFTVSGIFTDGVTETTVVHDGIPASDSSASAGVFREYRFYPMYTADTYQFVVEQTSATSRFEMGPTEVQATPQAIR